MNVRAESVRYPEAANPLSAKCCRACSSVSLLIHSQGSLSFFINLKYHVRGLSAGNRDPINPTRKRFDKFIQILPLSSCRKHLICRVLRKEKKKIDQRAQIN